MECGYSVPEVLQKPASIFQGLCEEQDEPSHGRGHGWYCYCGIPSHDYTEEGDRIPPRAGFVFLVFVTEELVAYNWRWAVCCPNKPNLPMNYQNRFKEQRL